MLRLLAVLGVLVLLLTACPADEPEEEAAEPTPTAEPDDSEEPDDSQEPEETEEPEDPGEPGDQVGWSSCTNPAAGYTVSYPQDWATNEGDERMDACQVFGTPPLDLPYAAQDLPLDLGVTMRVEPVDFDQVVGGDAGAELETSEDIEVDGYPAVREELVGTGETLFPEGTAFTRYAVDLGGETFVANSYDVGETPYQRKIEVLDEMMTTLELDDDA